MKLVVEKKRGAKIAPGMIGLFFEDINYAADGGLYAEMLENRSFEFLEAEGDAGDYYVHYDGGYGWSPYDCGRAEEPGSKKADKEETQEAAEGGLGKAAVSMRLVTGSPHTTENPHYMRLEITRPMCGMANQAYDGICLKKGMEYRITFWARCVRFDGNFCAGVVGAKDGAAPICGQGMERKIYAYGTVSAQDGKEETYNYFKKYTLTVTAMETVTGGVFVLCLDRPGVVEFDYVSMFPGDAVEGIFRRDLFEKLRDLKPGFIRFPGGCIIEGNTLENRYRYKDGLKEPWARRNNWNRWAVHGNSAENHFHSGYSHYNQTLGLGFYEYFLLCELVGAKPLPVLNVGLACQYQSTEQVPVDGGLFREFVQDALDLIEFANGGADTPWGGVRARMGHPEPFGLDMLGIGNEQWQTEKVDFFKRYALFEQAIHESYPQMKLIGSAGPDITSERYEEAWAFYHSHEEEENFVYAVDEHYYVKPQWLFDHVDFYDRYSRKIKVFSGEYAAHPLSGMNRPDANTLEGALAEAAFLTGVERNADVVVLASYAPLFAKVGYAQWSPDMIWFDGSRVYGTPSYYVQKMYGNHMGDVTLDTAGREKEAAKQGIYYSLSLKEAGQEIILKVVNGKDEPELLTVELASDWYEDGKEGRGNEGSGLDGSGNDGSGNGESGIDGSGNRGSGREKALYRAEILTGASPQDHNSLEEPCRVAPKAVCGDLAEGIELPPRSFAVIRVTVCRSAE